MTMSLRLRRDRGPNEQGFSLTELIAVVIILGVLASAVIPMTKITVTRAKEIELQRALREIRRAIDLHKKMAEEEKIEIDASDSGYPESMEILVEGVELRDSDRIFKFLRRMPKDPFTGEREWGVRGSEQDADEYGWDGEDVFDVYSLSEARAMDGSYYREW
jgi:general secretion pathway protein G